MRKPSAVEWPQKLTGVGPIRSPVPCHTSAPKSKTNKIIQVNPKTQHEKETLLLAIGEKRFEVFFPYLMYMSSRPIVW